MTLNRDAGGGCRIRNLRSPRELRLMRRPGLVVWQAHQRAARLVAPGVTTGELDRAVADVFSQYDAEPLFLGYPGPTPFPAVSCISVNAEVVHGIPGPRVLAEGDIVSIDTGCRIDGWCGDAAVTHPVGSISGKARKLLEVTSEALRLAIRLMETEKKWSAIAREMESLVNTAGFSVVEEMVGHGIGREMHEPPQVPNYFSAEWAQQHDFDLRPGVVLAIEPMVNIGKKTLRIGDDGWTQLAADGKWSAHFEHTIAITADGPQRLTGPPSEEELTSLPPSIGPPEGWLDW